MTRRERLEELSATSKKLIQEAEVQAKELADLRAKWIAAEGEIAYWREFTRSVKEEPRRWDGQGPQGQNALGFNIN